MRRVNFSDVIILALLYKNKYMDNLIISYDVILDYYKVIEKNLSLIENFGNYDGNYIGNNRKTFDYLIQEDENGKKYVALNPLINKQETYDLIIGTLPLDVLVASQKDNALEVIGLKKIENNEIVSKNYKIKSKNNIHY